MHHTYLPVLAVFCALTLTGCPDPAPMLFTVPLYELDLGDQVAATPAVSRDGTSLYVVTYHGKVLKIVDPGTASARSVFLADLEDTCVFPPVVGDDGSIYVNSGTGRVYRILDDGVSEPLIWKSEVAAPRTVDDQLVVGENTVFVYVRRYEEIVAYDRASGVVRYTLNLKSIKAQHDDFWFTGTSSMLATSGVHDYELVIAAGSYHVLLVKPSGDYDRALMGTLPPDEPDQAEYLTQDITALFVDASGGPVIVGGDVTYEKDEEDYDGDGTFGYHYVQRIPVLRRISASWNDLPENNWPLADGGEPGIFENLALSMTGGNLIAGRDYGFYTGGIQRLFFWNAEDGSLVRSYSLVLEPSDSSGWFSSSLDSRIYHTTDGTAPWVLFASRRSDTSYQNDAFLGRYDPANPDTVIPRTIALPDKPRLAEPVIIQNMVVCVFADGTLAAYAAPSGPLL